MIDSSCLSLLVNDHTAGKRKHNHEQIETINELIDLLPAFETFDRDARDIEA